jgi:Fe-S-cluster containining protein
LLAFILFIEMNGKMRKSIKQAYEDYLKLRIDLQKTCTALHNLHSPHTQCGKGCSSCCMDFGLMPVEFHYIVEQLKNKPIALNRETEKGQCIFLVNNECTIYEHRPIICRSHGLPILFMDEEGENYNLSFCPLNFNNVNDNYFSFENSYHQDTFNSKLYMINKAFIEAYTKHRYQSSQLVPIHCMPKFL